MGTRAPTAPAKRATTGSDIDLAVSYALDLEGLEYFERHLELHVYLRRVFEGFKVDLVDLSKMKDAVMLNFRKEGINVE